MKKKITAIVLFAILLTLICSVPVMGESRTFQQTRDIPLPFTGPGSGQTPLIHIADNGDIITVNCPYDPNFFVYDGNGSLLWNATLSAEQSSWISSVSIAPDGQYLVVTQLVPACCHGSVTNTSSNRVILFDRSGARSWEYPTYSPPLTSTVSSDNQEIFIGTGDGRIINLDREGTACWTAQIDAPVLSLATSLDSGTIVATGDSNYYSNKLYGESLNPHDLFVLDKNGTLLWNYQTRGTNTAAISDDGSVTAVLNERNGNLLLFNRTGGRQIERSFAGTPSAIALSGDANLIVVRTREGVVYGVDRNGSIVWNASLESGSQGIAITDMGNSLVLGDGKAIAIYNITGNRLNEYPVDSKVRSIDVSRDKKSLIIGTEQNLIVIPAMESPGTESTALTPIQTLHVPGQVLQTPKESSVFPIIPVFAVGCVIVIIVNRKGKF
jgi:outer membrane protein assembly factor BamB